MAREDDASGVEGGGHEKIGEFVRIYLRNGIWHANFQFNKKQVRLSLGTGSKKEARRRAARIDVKLTAGQWKPAIETVTVAEAVENYIDVIKEEGRAAKTLVKYNQVLAGVVALADKRCVRDLSGLDHRFLDAYRKMRNAGGAAPKTLYNACVILRQLIHFALKRNLLAADPMPGLKMPKPGLPHEKRARS